MNKRENYTVFGWMQGELKLTNNSEIIVFARIYAVTKDKKNNV